MKAPWISRTGSPAPAPVISNSSSAPSTRARCIGLLLIVASFLGSKDVARRGGRRKPDSVICSTA